MATQEQTQCPEPSCIYGLPDGDPDAHGWGYFSELWWCPLHSYGEYRRLKKQADERDWYDENIRLREQALADAETSTPSVRKIAQKLNLRRDDPRVRQEARGFAAHAQRIRDEIGTLKQNRQNAAARQAQENEIRCQTAATPSDFGEN
jgi:hypothetical protein